MKRKITQEGATAVERLVKASNRVCYLWRGISDEGFDPKPGSPIREALDGAFKELNEAEAALRVAAARGHLVFG